MVVTGFFAQYLNPLPGVSGLQTCHITIGGIGGDEYNMENEFLAAGSDVAKIEVSEILLAANWVWPVYTR